MLDNQSMLVRYCMKGKFYNNDIKAILNSSSNIDIFYNNYIYLEFATKNNNTALLEMLIEYYDKHTLSNYDKGSNEYLHEQAKLYNILVDEVLRCTPCSKETEEYIYKTVGYSDSDSQANDLDDSDIDNLDSSGSFSSDESDEVFQLDYPRTFTTLNDISFKNITIEEFVENNNKVIGEVH